MNQRYCNGMIHVIKKGDNLYQLSRRYRVPLALILRANPYVDVYNLQIGQEICIPVARPYPPVCGAQPREMSEGTREMSDGMTGRMSDGMNGEAQGDVEMANENTESPKDGTVTYVSDGTKSLGEILRENGIASLSDFLEKNDLNQIVIAADVVLCLPKKV